jgi:hypothetical protein
MTMSTRVSALGLAGHFLEMVVAMFVGMVLLGPLWSFVFRRHAAGRRARPDAPFMLATMLWRRSSYSH